MQNSICLIEKRENPYKERKPWPESKNDVGDVLIKLQQLAIAYDLDVAQAFRKAMNSIKKRYGMQ
jgi:NTP pyrophosphatase (non-canonical NTP hydrolase)